MFHILIENSTPNRLVGGYKDTPVSILECGLKGGQVREALSHQDVRSLSGQGKLNTERCCKQCLRRIGGRYGKGKNPKVSEADNSTESAESSVTN